MVIKEWYKDAHSIVLPINNIIARIITPANISDSSMLDGITKNIDRNILKCTILVCDFGYYDSERFKTFDEKCILFFTRMKLNIKYKIIYIEGKSKVS